MILLYHHIIPPEAVPRFTETPEGWGFRHTPTGFERQLIALKQRGYRFISLAELLHDLKKHRKEDPKTVVVTFDDGWIDNYHFALPVLKTLAIPATFFVISGHIKECRDATKMMNTAQLKELLSAGMTIGGHTRTHPDLTKLSPERARDEIAGCKSDLEVALHTKVQFFAYPGGAFNRDIVRLTKEAGYTAACSVLGPSENHQASTFWLYRDVLSESLKQWRDRYRLSKTARKLFSFRVTKKLVKQLERTD